MRKFSMMLAAAALAIAFAGTGSAQDEPKKGRPTTPGQPGGQRFGGGGFGGGGVYGFLANNKDLQTELKVTDEQKTKFEAVAKEQTAKMREMFTGGGFGRDMTDEQRKEMTEKMEKAAAETKKAYEAVLTSDQAKRVTQINYQYMGLRAFSDKEVQTFLKLTDEQKEKVKAVSEAYQKDVRELRGDGRSQPTEESTKKMAAARKEAEEKIAKDLTDEQKKTWGGLIGEKFDVSKLVFAPTRPRDN